MSSTNYSLGEEIAHSVTHGIGAVLSAVGMGFLIWLSLRYGNEWHLISSIVYGVSLLLLYSASTMYHALTHPGAKRFFQLLDHSFIFVLIAGTYTPFALVSLHGPWGWSLFGVVWGLTVLGTIVHLTQLRRFHSVMVGLYLVMGWSIIAAFAPLREALPSTGLGLLVAGGLSYSLGVVFYAWKRIPFNHAIWHLFVLTGSVLHFFAVLFYVVL